VKSIYHRIAGVMVVLLALGCASSMRSWEEVRGEDTPAAYHRFLRENPDAPQAPEARERLAFARLRKKPSAEGYAKFRNEYPGSPLLAEVRPFVEEKIFEQVLLRGTADAYAEYLADFPDGANARRAAGNAEYIEHGGFAGRPADLAAFAKRHPESDFAIEAGRSASAVDARRGSVLRRVGLSVEVAPGTPGAARVARTFATRAARHYARTGIELVSVNGAEDPRASRVDAILTIRHREEVVGAKIGVGSGHSSTPGTLATTEVILARKGDAQPIVSEEFTFKAAVSERRDDESLLFSAASSRYWEAFHFPTARWSNQLSTRTPFPVGKQGVAVDASGHRAVVLFEDGGFQVVDISDPAEPQIVGQYRRPRDLSKWKGLRIMGSQVALFGDNGLEMIDIASGSMQRVLAFDRTKVGGVVAVEWVAPGLLIAGSRGLLLLKAGATEPQLLLEKSVLGAALRGDRLVFTDGDSLFVASIPLLLRQKAEARLRIEKGFAPGRVRVVGSTAIVMGENAVLLVDVSDPRNLRVRSRVSSRAVGEIRDAIGARGRLFLLSERGLQVSALSGAGIDETVDVSTRDRIAPAGRHLVMIGDGHLQVVDTTPFVESRGVASPQR
jgi:hypothetical protein